MSIEDPDADVAEQLRPTSDTEDDPTIDDALTDPGDLPLEADPADVADQRAVVPDSGGDAEPRPTDPVPADASDESAAVSEVIDEP